MKKTCVLSLRALPTERRGILKEEFGEELIYFNLYELKNCRPKNIWKKIRALKVKKWIIIEEESAGLFPIMILLSWSKPVSNRWGYSFSSGRKRISIIDCFLLLGNVLFKTIQIQLNRLREEFFLRFSKNKKKIRAHFDENNLSIYYINLSHIRKGIVGGSIGHIRGVIKGFIDKGVRVHYASIVEDGGIDKAASVSMISRPSGCGFPYELNYYFISRKAIRQLKKEIKGFNPDFLYQRLSSFSSAGVVVSRKLNIPLIVEYNGSELWSNNNWGNAPKFPKLAMMTEELILKNAHKIIAVSEVLRKELISKGIEPNKISVYPNCVNTEEFSPNIFSEKEKENLRNVLGFSERDKIFTFIGTFGKWHGITLLAEVIAALAKEHRDFLDSRSIRFLLIGSGIEKTAVEQLIAESNTSKYVVMTGVIPQSIAPVYLSISDAFLSPQVPNPDGSEFFGSPTKLFEYMAMGKPIIASAIGQISSILSDGIYIDDLKTKIRDNEKLDDSLSAILCKPGSFSSLFDSIFTLGSHLDDLDFMGDAANKKVKKNYTWDKHADCILKNLRELSK